MKKSSKRVIVSVLVCFSAILAQFVFDLLLLSALEAFFQDRFLIWFSDPHVFWSLVAAQGVISLLLILLAIWFAKRFYRESK